MGVGQRRHPWYLGNIAAEPREVRPVSPRRGSKAIKLLGVIASLGMFLVDMVGFLDTQTGSALGCGQDWPLCHGQVIPHFGNVHVLIEFVHRAVVGGFALVAVALAIWAWARYRSSLDVKAFSVLSVGFIVIQSGLGALAVLFVNPPVVLALHLGFGLLALVGTTLLTVAVFQLESGTRTVRHLPRELGRLMFATWVYTFLAIYWGSYVAFRHAGILCRGWPLCNGRLLPRWGSLVWLDEIHRLAALGLAALVTVLLLRLYRRRGQFPELWPATVVLALLVASQIASGAWLVASRLATGPYLVHVGNLTVLFTVLSYLTYLSLVAR